jgi:DNA-binding CsgD family transcriptional regulator
MHMLSRSSMDGPEAGYEPRVTEASPETPTIADLVARSRSQELSRVRTMLGAGQRGDGLRLMRIDAQAGVGSTAFVDVVEASWDGPVVHLDARRGDGLGDDAGQEGPAVALELRARSAAARVEQLVERGRVLLAIDHAWEDDLAAALYGALVDALAEDADVSVLLVRRTDSGANVGGTWGDLLDEIGHRRPMPGVRLASIPGESIDSLVRLLHPERGTIERDRIVSMSGGVPRIAAMLAAASGTSDSLVEWVGSQVEPLGERERDALLAIALVDEGIPASAVDVDPAALPFARQLASGAWVVEPPAIRDVIRHAASTASRRVVAAEAEARLADATSTGALAARARLHAISGDRAGSRAMWTTLADELERAGDLEQAVIARRAAVAMSDRLEDRLASLAAAARTVREQGLRSPSEEVLVQLRRLADAAGDDELAAYSIRELAYTRRELELLVHPAILASNAGWAIEARAAAADVASRYDEVAELASRALAIARDNGDERLELYAHDKLLGGAAAVTPASPPGISAEQAAEQLAEVVERAWAIGARHRALLSSWTEGYVLGMTARFDLLAERMRARGAQARDAGRPNHASSLATYEAEGLRELARLDDAAELLDSLPELDPAWDDGYSAAFVGLARLALAVEVGAREGIRDRHAALVDSGTLRMHASLVGYYELIRLREALEVGSPAEAAAAVEAFVDADADDMATAAADVARVALRRGDAALLDAARAFRTRVAGAREDVPLVALALREADACLDGGEPAALAAAIDAWRSVGCELRALRLEVARAHVGNDASETELRELKTRLRRAGMRGAEDDVNALIRQRGGRAVAVAAPRGDAPLSSREQQIAALAVEGLTNAQIGTQLGIQPSTVARILANVYKRHGLRGRAALVTFMHDLER